MDIAELKRLADEPGDIGYNHLAFYMADHAKEMIDTIERLQRTVSALSVDNAALQHDIRRYMDIASSVSSLAEGLRDTLTIIAAQGSGIPGSADRVDCMASLASMALRTAYGIKPDLPPTT
jgi:hypothetical protein